MMFERIFNDNKVLIAVNRTDLSQKFIYPDDYKNYSKIYSLKKSRLGNLNNYGAVAIKK